MNEFFKFLFSPEIQKDVLREEWIKLYDYNYIDDKILDELSKNAERLEDLIGFVSNKSLGLGGSTMMSMSANKSSAKKCLVLSSCK